MDKDHEKALVLVIDDSLIPLRIAEKALRINDYEVITCQSGLEGIELAKDAQPNAILLDVMMPEIDGYETCRRLKSNPATAHIPVIFVTTLNRKVDIEDCIKAGGSGYISKPYTQKALFECVETHINLGRLTQEDSMRSPVQIKRAFKILIIDDSEVMRSIISQRLEEMEIEITTICEAGNGKEALNILSKERFDLCFCDWNMPQMNGLSFVRNVREKPEHEDMPIIMVTSEGTSKKMTEAQQAGANSYITKPFSHDDLKNRIKEVIATKIF